MELLLVLGTWALVGVTYWMARRQIALLGEQTQDNRANLRLQNHLAFAARFDSREMQSDRKILAQQVLSKAPDSEIPEAVLNFFEDLGRLDLTQCGGGLLARITFLQNVNVRMMQPYSLISRIL